MPENRPRTELPRGIPGPLRDFVRCRVDSAELEPGDLDWVPKPKGPMVPENLPDPSVSFAEGEGGGVDITLAWGFLSVTLSATVSGGKLSISAPSPLIPTGDIDAWVEDLNADLEANGKQLEGLSLVDGKLRATKQAIPAPVEEAAAVVAAPTAVAVTPPEEEPILGDGAPLGVRRFHEKWSTGQKAAAGGAGALALGVAAFFLFGGGDGDPAASEAAPPPAVATPSTTTTTTSTSTTSTSTTTTTMAMEDPPGTRVGMFEDPPMDAQDCSTQDAFASSLDLEMVEVFDEAGLITFRVFTSGPPDMVLDPVNGDWSGAVTLDVGFPDGSFASMIAQVHEGQPLVGMLDPSTGETAPNGIVVAGDFIDFGHRFEPPPTEFQVRVQSFHSTGPEQPVACDFMEFSIGP